MPDTPRAEGSFDFIRGRSERTVLSNVDEILTSLLPETVSIHPTVQWLRSLRERDSADVRGRDFYDPVSSQRPPQARAFIVRSILKPVVQARLDFLTQSLFPVARTIGVSDRAIEVTIASREPSQVARTLSLLRDDQHAEVAELRAAVSESLADLLTVAEDMHRRRRAAAFQVFDEWVAETNSFRSAFEPADKALGDELRGGGRRTDLDLNRSLGTLLGYLSRSPQLASSFLPDDTLAVRKRALVLSPGEIVGILLLAVQSLPADEERESYRRELDLTTSPTLWMS
jgi:hypothetical protein